MTHREEKKVRNESESDDRTPDETVAEVADEEFTGVHILGEEDMEKHFGPLEQDPVDETGQEIAEWIAGP